MSPARQAESTICGISFALDSTLFLDFRHSSLTDALQARSSDRFLGYNSRTDSSVLPLCPPWPHYQQSLSSVSPPPHAFSSPAALPPCCLRRTSPLRAAAPSRPLQIR